MYLLINHLRVGNPPAQVFPGAKMVSVIWLASMSLCGNDNDWGGRSSSRVPHYPFHVLVLPFDECKDRENLIKLLCNYFEGCIHIPCFCLLQDLQLCVVTANCRCLASSTLMSRWRKFGQTSASVCPPDPYPALTSWHVQPGASRLVSGLLGCRYCTMFSSTLAAAYWNTSLVALFLTSTIIFMAVEASCEEFSILDGWDFKSQSCYVHCITKWSSSWSSLVALDVECIANTVHQQWFPFQWSSWYYLICQLIWLTETCQLAPGVPGKNFWY